MEIFNMANKFVLNLTRFFFKFNTAFLSAELEERLKSKQFSGNLNSAIKPRVRSREDKFSTAPKLLIWFLRKKIAFTLVAFAVFCFCLSQIPLILQQFSQLFMNEEFCVETIFSVHRIYAFILCICLRHKGFTVQLITRCGFFYITFASILSIFGATIRNISI